MPFVCPLYNLLHANDFDTFDNQINININVIFDNYLYVQNFYGVINSYRYIISIDKKLIGWSKNINVFIDYIFSNENISVSETNQMLLSILEF